MNLVDVLPSNWRDAFDPEARRIGIGIDPATTTKKLSNPSSIAVIQQVGLSYFARLLLRFKTSDPDVTTGLLRELVTGMPHGLKVRRIAILATNERFYAAGLRKAFAGIVPVEQLVESEKTTYLGEEMLFKSYLGNQLINTIDDGYLAVADEPWVKNDLRQTTREKGLFVCEPDENGNHADGFCALGAALHACAGKGGPAEAAAVQVGRYGAPTQSTRKIFNQYARKKPRRAKLHT